MRQEFGLRKWLDGGREQRYCEVGGYGPVLKDRCGLGLARAGWWAVWLRAVPEAGLERDQGLGFWIFRGRTVEG